ncbi:MAG: response regulator [Ignavibacteria bacterium]
MKRAETRVIIADDHTLFRIGLVRMLNSFPGVKVVAEASDGTEVLKVIDHVEADLLILDLTMPGANGTSLLEAVRRTMPGLPVLVLSMHDEATLVKQVLRSGASGYITKNAEPDVLQAAVSAVARGERYLAPAIANVLAFDFEPEPGTDPMTSLSQRERQVLRMLVGDGLSLVQIAEQLELSPKTVTTHKANIMAKLGVSTNADLMRYVLSRPPADLIR